MPDKSTWIDLPEARFAPPATAQRLDLAAVRDHLAKAGLAVDMDRGARQLAGGLANQNFLICVDGTPVVLRRPPAGPLPPGAHDMTREHRILSRLPDALPAAPRSLHLCADPAVIGVPFQLLEFRDGLIVRGDVLPDMLRSATACRQLSVALVTMLASIHAVDTGAIGLGDLGRPQGFYARAVEGWAGRAAAADEATRTCSGEIAAWLRARPVAAATAALLHCDFKLDNCILDPRTFDITTVIDWDMGTRGDALFDLATTLSYWTEPGDPACMHTLAQMPSTAPGFLRRAEAIAQYAQLTGRDLADLPAYRVLAVFKLAVVFLQLHQRWLTGAVRDPRYETFQSLGRELMDYARAIARGEYV